MEALSWGADFVIVGTLRPLFIPYFIYAPPAHGIKRGFIVLQIFRKKLSMSPVLRLLNIDIQPTLRLSFVMPPLSPLVSTPRDYANCYLPIVCRSSCEKRLHKHGEVLSETTNPKSSLAFPNEPRRTQNRKRQCRSDGPFRMRNGNFGSFRMK